GRLEWNGNSLSTVFAQRKNLVSPSFLWMLREVLRFNRICVADRDAGFCDELTIGEYMEARAFGPLFRDNYLIPMSAAIWSTPRAKMLDFPARTFIDFFANHRLINHDRPLWRTVKGGSKNYLGKLLSALDGRTHLNAPVRAILRDAEGVTVTAEGRAPERFDHVVLASHSDQALAMLLDADTHEREILGAVKYGPNRVVLHRDPTLMPVNRRAWASWNAMRSSEPGDEQRISLTYWMNKLQSIDRRMPLFVSLNPHKEPAGGTVFGEWSFEHPLFDKAAVEAQGKLARIQGARRTWFAGAWTGYGFHEDGLRSGLAVARALNSPALFDDAFEAKLLADKPIPELDPA
ncbi:MAG: FAD-dependent oxidoreductase, partial [Rhizobiaceae bacterium]|nr:FAD-dependent oxidoreductase [Rhizobiaceae bacterium]